MSTTITANNMTPSQRAQVIRSARKIEQILGSSPKIVDNDDMQSGTLSLSSFLGSQLIILPSLLVLRHRQRSLHPRVPKIWPCCLPRDGFPVLSKSYARATVEETSLFIPSYHPRRRPCSPPCCLWESLSRKLRGTSLHHMRAPRFQSSACGYHEP